MIFDADVIKATVASSLRESVTTYFRDAILRGEIPAGQAIPPTRELATLLDTSSPNIHHALAPLVKEGLIVRSKQRGTIVNERQRQLTCAVVYVHNYTFGYLPQFQAMLVEAIGQELRRRGIECRLVIDNITRYGFEQVRQWAELGTIQGIIMPFAGRDWESIGDIAALPVPAVFMTGQVAPGNQPRLPKRRVISLVDTDWRELGRQAVAGLKQQGASRIGLISSIEFMVGEEPHEHPFYSHFRQAAGEAGLELRPEWIQAVATEREYLRTPAMSDRFAYDRCSRLLALAPEARPDGLFIFSDALINGSLLALLQHGVAVPDDLRLVVYRNWEIDAVALPPCVMVGLSVADTASAFVTSVVAQFNGKRVAAVSVPYETRLYQGEAP